ncbi:MAG: DUF3798 domain-containing protein [Spirochaetales bacterium]|nr:DUF3798 domain-containing protein [Spirochaetales bacterium]
MKKASALVLVLALAVSTLHAETPFHIGVVTGGMAFSEEELRGAEELIRRYGKASDGGMIKHITYPDNFMEWQEVYIGEIIALADDPRMKAIVVNQAIPGTATAFSRVREIRPDILLLAGEPHDDPLFIDQVADIVVSLDFINRGYAIVHAAKELGAQTFVHISFPRHMSYETLAFRRKVMEAACAELGLAFVVENVPDPLSDLGIYGAQRYLLDVAPRWVEKYGKDTAFFSTSDAHIEPLIRQLLEHGGLFIEPDLPSPRAGYPGALGLDLSRDAGDFTAILKKVEKAVAERGGAGRFGTWAYSYGFTVTAGLGEYAKNVVEGMAEMGDSNALHAAFAEYTPGAAWSGGPYFDASTGVRARNHLLVYMDTYVLGKGFLDTTSVKVDPSYSLSALKSDAPPAPRELLFGRWRLEAEQVEGLGTIRPRLREIEFENTGTVTMKFDENGNGRFEPEETDTLAFEIRGDRIVTSDTDFTFFLDEDGIELHLFMDDDFGRTIEWEYSPVNE